MENGVFANVQEYFTKEESVYEAHKKYIDLQYIGLYIHYIVIASRKPDLRYDTIEEYLDKYDSEYLLIANSFAATYPDDYAFYFLATSSIDGVEYTHRLNFNYISDYFEIPVADVEMDNSGVIL